MYHTRSRFRTTPFSAIASFVAPPPEPVIEANPEIEEDPAMQEKAEIVEKRIKKMKDPKKKNKGLPGQRLLKKLAKEQQLERVLSNVVKSLH